jgi:chromosome segregation ATPase
MSRGQIRQQVEQYLIQHGPFEDSTGRATAKLKEVLGYEGTNAGFTQLIANMDRAGQLTREVRGKRTYRITAVADGADAARSSVDRPLDVADNAEMDYDKVASALLLQVVQTLTEGNRQRGSDGSWARRRIERLESRINDLERDLLQAKAESRTLAAERDELRQLLENSQANLALLSDRVSTGKPREGQLSKLLGTDERALLHQLRGNAADNRPGRAG